MRDPAERDEDAVVRGREDGRDLVVDASAASEPRDPRPRDPALRASSIRVMTYNAHGAVGLDGQRSLDRLTDALRTCDADIIGLQEIDVGRTRSGGLDQAEAIAVRLGMGHVFGAALYDGAGEYGNAVLSRFPIEHVRTEKLPTWRAVSEPRCFVHTRVAAPDGPLDVLVTHFGLGPIERIGQARHVAAELARSPTPHLVLLADLNCGRGSIAYRKLTRVLGDAQQIARPGQVRATYPSWRPILRIDHVLVGAGLEVCDAEVPMVGLVREASDHLPVIVTLRRRPASERDIERARSRLA